MANQVAGTGQPLVFLNPPVIFSILLAVSVSTESSLEMITNWGVSATAMGDFSDAQWHDGSTQELGEHLYQLDIAEPERNESNG